MLAALKHALTRVLGGVALATLMTACGGSDSGGEPSSSQVVVAGADGASVTFDKRIALPKRDVTIRIAKDASGAPPLSPNVMAVSGIYAFTPLGQLTPVAVIRVPFDAASVPRGARVQLLVAVPGEPWMQVLDARIEGATMVAQVPRLSHAVVVATSTSGSSRLAKIGAQSTREATDPAPPSLTLAVASATPALDEPIEHEGSRAPYLVLQPTQVTLRLAYRLPEACVSPRQVQLTQIDGDLDANGELLNQRTSVVAMIDAPSSTGQIDMQHTFAAGRHEAVVWLAQASCQDQEGYPAFFGFAGAAFVVDTRSTQSSAPVIDTHPQGRSVVEGESVGFSVAASGATSYQWQRSNDGGVSFVPVGQSSPSVELVATLADNGSLWRVLASNAAGVSTSNVAQLTVTQRVVAPTVTSDPSPQAVLEGETASFTVVGTGTPAPTIEWQVRGTTNSDPEAGWSAIEGATSATYTTPPTTLPQSGAQYRAVLRNVGGSAATLPATLTVQLRVVAPAITTHPQSLAVEAGRFGAFAVSATGTSPLSYQWFRDGQAIVGATAAEVLILASDADVGSIRQIAVQVSNSAGSVTSNAAQMTVSARPPTGTPVSVTAAEGGAIELSGDVALSFPPGAVLSDTTVLVRSIPAGDVQLPAGYVPTLDAIEIGPAGLSLTQPVTLSVPSPESVSADKVWALVELPLETETQALRVKGSPNVRRAALGLQKAGSRTLAATSAPLNVYCATSQSAQGGRQLVHLHRAARYVSTEVAQAACTAGATVPKPVMVPSTTSVPCEENEFVSDSLGNDVLKSRHVHCGANSTDLGWIQDEKGNYGYFRLSWRVGSDGAASLKKNYRLKFLLERTQAPDANPVNTPLSFRIDARLDCVSQQYVGACSGNKGFTNVTAGQGWSNEIFMPVQFSWTGGNGTLNEFVFGQITLSYALPSQNGASTLLIQGPPTLRCDKGLAHSTRSGCVYAQAPAVFVLSSTDVLVAEAAQHIKDAQSAPMQAPGRLEFVNGQPHTSGSLALQRTRFESVRKANRDASCNGPSAIIKTRLPVKRTPFCEANDALCECDEYPFAATWSGAYFDPDRTSARRIKGAHNSSAGARFGNFLTSERVIDFSQYDGSDVDAFDPLLLRSRSGDDFWIHIE